MTKEALEALQTDFSDLMQWLKPLCRFDGLDDFIVADYKENKLNLELFTKDHRYCIVAHLPRRSEFSESNGDKGGHDDGYLGCIVTTRKPRAGEDWNRGNDLADGSYSKETFDRIICDIVAFELVRVVKSKSYDYATS